MLLRVHSAGRVASKAVALRTEDGPRQHVQSEERRGDESGGKEVRRETQAVRISGGMPRCFSRRLRAPSTLRSASVLARDRAFDEGPTQGAKPAIARGAHAMLAPCCARPAHAPGRGAPWLLGVVCRAPRLPFE